MEKLNNDDLRQVNFRNPRDTKATVGACRDDYEAPNLHCDNPAGRTLLNSWARWSKRSFVRLGGITHRKHSNLALLLCIFINLSDASEREKFAPTKVYPQGATINKSVTITRDGQRGGGEKTRTDAR